MIISAANFKANCLKLMDVVNKEHNEIIITKYGKEVAKLVSIDSNKPSNFFGLMKKQAVYGADIIESSGEKWDAE